MTNRFQDSFTGINSGMSLAVYFSLLTFFFSLSSCGTDVETADELRSITDLPSETAKDAEIIYSDSARVKMKLMAVQLDRFVNKNYIEFPKGVKIDFYDDSLKVNSKLKADYGIRYEKEGKMEAKRNVEVINVNGEKLNTEHLIWEEATERIHTGAAVTITNGNEVIFGDGLESNQDFTRYKITNIKGTINLKDEPQD